MTGRTRGIRADQVKRLKVVLARLAASAEPKDMGLPGSRLHPLKGDMKGYFAVDVSGNWRVVFAFEGQDVIDVDLVDYH